jgi:hypothetical protein
MMHRYVVTAVAVCLLIGAMLVSSGERPAGPVANPNSNPQPKPAAEAAYSGNTNTHKFHVRTCRYSHCTNCTATFATRREAIEAGYRPCGICEP